MPHSVTRTASLATLNLFTGWAPYMDSLQELPANMLDTPLPTQIRRWRPQTLAPQRPAQPLTAVAAAAAADGGLR